MRRLQHEGNKVEAGVSNNPNSILKGGHIVLVSCMKQSRSIDQSLIGPHYCLYVKRSKVHEEDVTKVLVVHVASFYLHLKRIRGRK